ncbi:MAG: hypothetical protein ACI8Y4_003632 [Candidatus Poriferisodalaceae bacterium]
MTLQVHLVPLSSTQSSATLLAVVLGSEVPEEVSVEIVDSSDSERALPNATLSEWRVFEANANTFTWARCTLDGLEPNTCIDVTARAGGHGAGPPARVTALPAADSTEMNLVVGSCFEPTAATAPGWGAACADACSPFGNEPFQQFWLGDQVYVDAPWKAGFKKRDAAEFVAGKYLEAWGIADGHSPAEMFAHTLRRSSNRFLADDHEFWNGYPRLSWMTMFGPAMQQLMKLAPRVLPVGRRHHLHPSSEGQWGAAAGEAFAIFQSTVEFEQFDSDVSPDPIQELDFANHRILMVDTRWCRSMLRKGKRASFMSDDALQNLIKRLDTDKLVIVMISKPLVGYPPKGQSRWSLEAGPENYIRQYTELCAAVFGRAERKLPTVVLAGDVHFHAVRTAGSGHVLEIVTSAMSMLDPQGKFVLAIRWLKDSIAKLTKRGDVSDVSYPQFSADGSWELAAGHAYRGRGTEGDEPLQSAATSLRLNTADPTAPRISYRCVPVQAAESARTEADELHFRWDPTSGWELLSA